MNDKIINIYKEKFIYTKIYFKKFKSNFVFQFDEVNKYDTKGEYLAGVKELRQEVILSLNSINHTPINKLKLFVNPNDETEILNNGELFITIRGWGNLTGTGANNFTSDKATKIQNDFRDWIIYKLSQYY